MVFCPGCYSSRVRKYGTSQKNMQKYRCSICGKQFTDNTGTDYSGMRYPENVIRYSLNLYYRHGQALRNINQNLEGRGVKISHVAIHDWKRKFGSRFTDITLRSKPYTKQWHVSGDHVAIKGERRHMWVVHDTNGNVIGIRVTLKRSLNQVENALQDAVRITGYRPDAILGAELETIRKQLRKFYQNP